MIININMFLGLTGYLNSTRLTVISYQLSVIRNNIDELSTFKRSILIHDYSLSITRLNYH
jgi:hypothetical protein